MTPETIKKIRQTLGMSQRQFAIALRLSPDNGHKTVRGWEKGGQITGPVSLAVEYLLRQTIDSMAQNPKKEAGEYEVYCALFDLILACRANETTGQVG